MNQFLLVFLVTFGSIIPAYFILRAIFGKSVMVTLSIYTASFTFFCCFIYYVAGVYGPVSLFRTIPVEFILGTIVYLYLNTLLKKPLAHMINCVKSVSEGNLIITLDDSHAIYELGILNASLKRMVENMNNVVSEIANSAENLAIASDKFKVNSSQLSEASGLQAASVEEVSSTMEEMAANIENNSNSAKQTEIIAIQLSQVYI